MTISVPPLHAADAQSKGELLLTDFTSGSTDLEWYVLNDNVMGGRSEGNFELEPGELRFAGRTNTIGGGFSSIRTRTVQLDLSDHAGIQLRVQGDGRRYTWRLATPTRWRDTEVGYWADFETRSGQWDTINIPFSSFVPRVRGRLLDGPPLDTGQVTGMGLMIYDNQDGRFDLRLARVVAYSGAPFTLMQYQWKNRVLVISASTGSDLSLGEQQDAIARTSEEFADRDMVLLTLLDDADSTAGNRILTTQEAASLRTTLGIVPGSFALRLLGKDGSVKLSSETTTAMNEIYALIDTMPMRQRETPDR